MFSAVSVIRPFAHSHQKFTHWIRTLSVKDDHHKFRLEYRYGLPLVMRASKTGGVEMKLK